MLCPLWHGQTVSVAKTHTHPRCDTAHNGWIIAKHLCRAQHAVPLRTLELAQVCLQGVAMQSWQKFLDSLSTKGGNLFVLFICFAGLLGLLIHVLHHGDTGNVSMVVVATFSGFSGALMATLTGKDSKEQSERVPNGNATGAPTPSPNAPTGTVTVAIPASAARPSTDDRAKIDGPVS
jgi:hypothetical protein